MSYGRPVWAEVNLAAIDWNMKHIKALLKPGTKFCPVIKADGYGHGAIATAGEAIANGAEYLAVSLLQEGQILREAGITLPILLLNYTPPEMSTQVVGDSFTQTIYTLEQAQALSQAATALGRTVRVHVKIDTGMARLGVHPADAFDFCRAVVVLPGLELEGMFTHFATADSLDKTFAREQFAKFKSAFTAVRGAGIPLPICHCANSATILDLPEMHLDMVRPGIILYGLEASDETSRPFPLAPAMHLRGRLSMVKTVPAGTPVSYGSTFRTEKETQIATVPIGYADGYTRMLSRKAQVLVAGKKVPVVGRICMDQCMVDVTGLTVAAGDPVTLFGPVELSADEIAAHLGTINYEVVCMIGKRVPRVYVRDNVSA